MSATGISAISLSQINPPFVVAGPGQRLKSSIQAGDLAGAQQAFNALSALHNGNGPFKNPTLASDFAAVGTALQAGDLAGAQQAAATLQRAINHHRDGGTVNPDVILRISPAAPAAISAPSAPSTSAGSRRRQGPPVLPPLLRPWDQPPAAPRLHLRRQPRQRPHRRSC
jgi:hypothetical protein